MFPMPVDLQDNVNPIRYARSLDQLSQAKLARALAISRPFLIRVEQGCYKTPGDQLINYASKTLEIPVEKINLMYINYQMMRRAIALESLMELTPISGPVAAQVIQEKSHSERVATRIFNHQVFREWREGYWNSVSDFSVAMCVHPDSVRKYELGEMLRMPEQLQDVLRQCNLLGNIDTDTRWYYA